MHAPVVLGLDFGGSKIAVRRRRHRPASGWARPRFRCGADDSAQQSFDRGVAAAHDLLAERAPGGAGRGRSLHVRDPPRRRDRPGAEHRRLGAAGLRRPDARWPSRGPSSGWRPTSRPRRRPRPSHGALVGHDPGAVRQPRHRAGGGDRRRRPRRHRTPRRGRRDRLQPAPRRRRRCDAPRLEEVVSGKALADRPRALLDGATSPTLFEQRRPRPARGRFVTEFCRRTGFHLVNLTIAIDPSRIAVGGGMVRLVAPAAPGPV